MSTTESGQRCIGDWIVDANPLGQGSFAVVWKATHRTTCRPAAIKEINLTKLNARLRQSLESEISVLSRISHRNVVQLYEVLETHGRMFIIMEYCSGGDLSQYFKAKGRISEKEVRYLMQDLAAGLREMWTHHLVHRDLKPQNLLLSTPATSAIDSPSPPPTLKIADFGFARALGPHLMAETLCGSPLYMAPEILLSQKYDAKADLWSVGTILYEALAGKPPYTGGNQVALLRNIRDREARLPPEVATQVSQHCRSLVYALLKRNVTDRLTFEEFFEHPFFLSTTGGTTGDDAGFSGEKKRSSPPQQIVGFEDGGALAGANTANPVKSVATTTVAAGGVVGTIEAPPVSQLTEQFKPRLVSVRRPVQIQRPIPVVQTRTAPYFAPHQKYNNTKNSIAAKDVEEEEEDYVMVTATNSINTSNTLAATPSPNESGMPHSVDARRGASPAAPATAAVPQEAFLLQSKVNQPQTVSHKPHQYHQQHQQHDNNKINTSAVFDAVPWQAASRRQFLRTMASILNTLAKDLDKSLLVKPTTASFYAIRGNNNNTIVAAPKLNAEKKIEILAQQLSLYIASLQLYDLVLSRSGSNNSGKSKRKVRDMCTEDKAGESGSDKGIESALGDVCAGSSGVGAVLHGEPQNHSMHSSSLRSAESSIDSGGVGVQIENIGEILHKEAVAVLHRAETTFAELNEEMKRKKTTTAEDRQNNFLLEKGEEAVSQNLEVSSSFLLSSSSFLPNPWQACHSAALGWAAEAASEELLGNYTRSEKLYCRAGTVLHFLSAEAGAISSATGKKKNQTGAEAEVKKIDTLPVVELAAFDEVKLRRCASAAAVRWAVCSFLAEKEAQEEGNY